MDRPNILLIVFDTARADSFEPYGAPSGSTPTVAQMAADGLAHQQAYAPSSWTVPSHISMFTGLNPRQAGLHLIEQTHQRFQQVLDHFQDRTLQRVLSNYGYRTLGISANGWVTPASGFDIGFDEFHHIPSERHAELGSQSLRTRAHWAVDALRANLDDGAAKIETLLTEKLPGSTPFFCFTNLVECHSPYLPPKPFNRLGWRGRMKAAEDANHYCTLESFWSIALGVAPLPPEESLERMRSLYACSIAQLDSWLARIMEALDRARILDETQVIVTSDHGENFGEGGLTGHNFSLDDRLLRVPFVTAGPLELEGSGFLSLVDLPSALARALELPETPWRPLGTDRGAIVAQLPASVHPDDPKLEAGVERYKLGEAGRRMLLRTYDCATDGQLKVIRDDIEETVIDLLDDPGEITPLSAQDQLAALPADRLAKLRHLLDEADRSALSATPWMIDVGPDTTIEEDAQLAEQMRLLGYM